MENFRKFVDIMSFKLRESRRFSTAFKKEKVRLIKEGKLKVTEISKVYNVSRSAVYKWLHLYGDIPKSERMVVEKISEESKNIELLKKIRDLEAEVGRLHIENRLKEEIISCGSDLIGEDLKKKYFSRQSKD